MVDPKCHREQCSFPTSPGDIQGPQISQAKFLGTYPLHMPKEGKKSTQTQMCTQMAPNQDIIPHDRGGVRDAGLRNRLVLECRPHPSGPPSVPHAMLQFILEAKVPVPVRKSERKSNIRLPKKTNFATVPTTTFLTETFEVVPPKLN